MKDTNVSFRPSLP